MEVFALAEITKEEVKRIADLARIGITDEETDMFQQHLQAFSDFAKQLDELDTTEVEPTSYVIDMKNVLRKDEPAQWTTQQEVLENAPDQQDGHFRVPSILE